MSAMPSPSPSVGALAERVAELEAQLAVDQLEHKQAREALTRILANNARLLAVLLEFTDAAGDPEVPEVPEVPGEFEPPRPPVCRSARWFLLNLNRREKGGA
jgi:hypothetical protein